MKLLRAWGIGVVLSLLLVNAGCVWAGATEHQGPSFDCAKAGTKIEKMICADAELSKLDAELAELYNEKLEKSPADKSNYVHSQRRWMKERNRCKRTTCLVDQYRQRIGELTPAPEFKTIYPVDISEFEINCDNPRNAAEERICKDKFLLLKVYGRMRNALQWALMRNQDKESIRASQRQWQKELVQAGCQDDYCILKRQYERINVLDAMAVPPNECYVPMPLFDAQTGLVEPLLPIFQAFEVNLNKFCDQPPMVCGLKVAPQFREDITFPTWTPIDPEANLGLIERFYRTPSVARSGETNKLKEEIWLDEKKKIDASLAAKTLTFAKSRVDFYNLDKAQEVYRIDYGTCQADNPGLRDRGTWDQPLKSAPVRIDLAPDVAASFYKENFLVGTFFVGNIFSYLGETYAYWMFGTRDMHTKADVNELFIFRRERWANPMNEKQLTNLDRTEVARFRYHSKGGQ